MGFFVVVGHFRIDTFCWKLGFWGLHAKKAKIVGCKKIPETQPVKYMVEGLLICFLYRDAESSRFV